MAEYMAEFNLITLLYSLLCLTIRIGTLSIYQHYTRYSLSYK
jgi:hypothetical protein